MIVAPNFSSARTDLKVGATSGRAAPSFPSGQALKVCAISPQYRAIIAFSAKKPDRLLSITAQFVHFRVKNRFSAGYFVIFAFVFMHIAGSIFIFNISKGQRVLPRILLP